MDSRLCTSRRGGTLGGLEVNYVDALTDLLAKARIGRPRPNAATGRHSPRQSRSHTAPTQLTDVPLWSEAIQLPKAPVTDSFYPSPRMAETKHELLSYHPHCRRQPAGGEHAARDSDVRRAHGPASLGCGCDDLSSGRASRRASARHGQYAGRPPIHAHGGGWLSVRPLGRSTYQRRKTI